MNGMARAAVMTAANAELRLVEYPLPDPPPGAALVKVACCTICRSDLHTWRGRRPGPTPAILGHEIVGAIAELGVGLTSDAADQPLAIGDRVTWTLHSSCGTCRACRDEHLPMKCASLHKFGHDACDQPPHFLGGFAEYCLVDAGAALLKLPDELDEVTAAPANCATATIVAGWEAAELQPCDAVLVQGAGALGCYAAALAAFAGAKQVIVADIDAGRLEQARQFGATDCLDAADLSPDEFAERVRQLTGGAGVDCALEVAGAPGAVPAGLAALRIGGRYIEQGCSFPAATTDIDLSMVLWNRLTIRGVHNYDFRHLRRAVEFLTTARNRFPFDRIVGERFPLERINEALRAAELAQSPRVAIVFDQATPDDAMRST